jgi:two-component system, OmpR family, sensor histidine kinase CreC
MKIRARIFLAILLTMGIGFSALVHWVTSDLEPQFRKSTEEPQMDSALVLAAIASSQVENGIVNTALFRESLINISTEIAPAKIYDFVKTTMDLRIYLTDVTGKVIFDSAGRDEGKDYSRWNDVLKTLRGEYGTRTSHDPELSVMYVAAPIMADKKIVGALSVGKPTTNVNVFVEKSRTKIIFGTLLTFGAVVLATLIISAMITRPIERLTAYARSVGHGQRASLPDLGKGEMAALGKAFEEMRTALEGKQYVENYIQTLTHEMKSPIAAIQGAAELLKEDMPPARRKKFLDNVESETARIQQLIERLLLLSSVENQQTLQKVEDIDLSALAREVAAIHAPLGMIREVAVEIVGERALIIRGERFLVRQAVANLVQNAIEFSPPHSTILISISQFDNVAQLTVKDHGPGIPDYALSQVFARFYSLKRPDTGKKSTGIGLSLVREAMLLHGGSATLENLPEGGALATITFPSR